jgi:Protein of unknown function (DUF3822)
LSVQITLTGLSFLVSTQESQDALYYSEKKFSSQYTPEEFLQEIKKELAATALIKECKEVCLVYANTSYTLVPDALFDETRLSEYLKFNSKILAGDFIAYDTISSQGLHVVHVPFVNVNNFMFENFGDFQYFHAASVLLQAIFDKGLTRFETTAFIQVYETHFDLIIIKDGLLQLCNSYTYKTPEDLAYYVLFALEQLQLKPDALETKVLGNIEENDANFAILYTYIRNIEILTVQDAIIVDQLKSHQQLLLKNCF